ncbi:FAD-dependent oxidoreductase [Megalodesulfovibrio paquesii]
MSRPVSLGSVPVLVIGGGVTGLGVLRDLALRGVPALLVEKRDLAAGASGGNHGLLHSGGRYVGSDPHAARECLEEGRLLKRLAPHCIEDTSGLFVAVAGDDEAYIEAFPALCARSGLPAVPVAPRQAREMEPCLAGDVIAAYEVEDGSIDPFMLCLDMAHHACALGARLRRGLRLERLELTGNHPDRRIARAHFVHDHTGQAYCCEPELVINASGAWAGLVAAMAGLAIPVLFSQGTLIITQHRLAHRVINRLRPAADADILVPGGSVSILGTTSVRIEHPDCCRPTVAEVDRMLDDARAMIPALESSRYIRAYAGVRPLVGSMDHADSAGQLGQAGQAGQAKQGGQAGSDRAVSRGFTLVDHARGGVPNCISITGGKLTTFRLMAEKAVDLACEKLGVQAACRTRTEPLPSSQAGRWTEPTLAARAFVQNTWVDRAETAGNVVLCECEMVSARVINNLLQEFDPAAGPLLQAINTRSRAGKGPCQGAFCGPRITAHLYDAGVFEEDAGCEALRAFVARRWRGKMPVLWGRSLQQAELQEAMLCGLLELQPPPTRQQEP